MPFSSGRAGGAWQSRDSGTGGRGGQGFGQGRGTGGRGYKRPRCGEWRCGERRCGWPWGTGRTRNHGFGRFPLRARRWRSRARGCGWPGNRVQWRQCQAVPAAIRRRRRAGETPVFGILGGPGRPGAQFWPGRPTSTSGGVRTGPREDRGGSAWRAAPSGDRRNPGEGPRRGRSVTPGADSPGAAPGSWARAPHRASRLGRRRGLGLVGGAEVRPAPRPAGPTVDAAESKPVKAATAPPAPRATATATAPPAPRATATATAPPAPRATATATAPPAPRATATATAPQGQQGAGRPGRPGERFLATGAA